MYLSELLKAPQDRVLPEKEPDVRLKHDQGPVYQGLVGFQYPVVLGRRFSEDIMAEQDLIGRSINWGTFTRFYGVGNARRWYQWIP